MTTTDALRKALEALEMARNGLAWYRARYPEAVDGSDDEAEAEIHQALADGNAALSSHPHSPSSEDPDGKAFRLAASAAPAVPAGAVWLMPIATEPPARPELLRLAWARTGLSTGQIAEAYDAIVSAAFGCGQVAAPTPPKLADSGALTDFLERAATPQASDGPMQEDLRAIARDALATQPPKVEAAPWTQADAVAWGERHDLKIHGNDLFCAFEDAATLYLERAATPQPAEQRESRAGGWRMVCGDWRDELVAIHGPAGHIASGLTVEQAQALITAQGNCSTTQESKQ